MLVLASCSPMVDSRGYSNEGGDMSQIMVGVTRAEDVAAVLGSPTTRSNFGEEVWYYVSQRQERVGMFAPKVTEQHVMAISFDSSQVVSNVSEFTKEQGKPVQLVSKTTPTEGHDFTFVEQMLGNLGRFNAPGRGMNDRYRR